MVQTVFSLISPHTIGTFLSLSIFHNNPIRIAPREMAHNLGSMNPSLLPQQASQIWNMLDEMAQDDPKAYQSFIQKNLNQGSELFSKPKSEVSIRAVFNTPPSKTAPKYVYINIFTWKQITEPKSADSPVPMTCSDMKIVTIDKIECYIVSVAVNPNLYAECCENKPDLDQLFELIITYVSDMRDLDIKPEFSRLKTPCKGDTTTSATWLYETIYRNIMPADTGTPPPRRDLIDELSNLSVKDSPPVVAGENKLVEEIQDEKENPIFTSRITSGDNNENVLMLCITLPRVKTVSELDLRISQDEIYLSNLYYGLSTDLECAIDEKSVKAKFDKSTHILTVTANCLQNNSN